jgi:hypothetical protein
MAHLQPVVVVAAVAVAAMNLRAEAEAEVVAVEVAVAVAVAVASPRSVVMELHPVQRPVTYRSCPHHLRMPTPTPTGQMFQ